MAIWPSASLRDIEARAILVRDQHNDGSWTSSENVRHRLLISQTVAGVWVAVCGVVAGG